MPQAGHGVDEIEGVRAPQKGSDLGHGVQDTGGRLGVDEGNDPVGLLLDPFLDRFRDDRRAPGELDGVHVRAEPRCDLPHPDTEDAVYENEDPVAGFHQVDEAGLHPGRAGPRHGDGQLVFRVHDRPEHFLQFIHDLQEIGVQVPQGLPAEGPVDFGGHTGGPRSHQQDFLDAFEHVFHLGCSSSLVLQTNIIFSPPVDNRFVGGIESSHLLFAVPGIRNTKAVKVGESLMKNRKSYDPM